MHRYGGVVAPAARLLLLLLVLLLLLRIPVDGLMIGVSGLLLLLLVVYHGRRGEMGVVVLLGRARLRMRRYHGGAAARLVRQWSAYRLM